ncbi:MAG: 4-amino-4-deoxy-L-arabinose transferase, partial [Gammaproteobacteria bacterium]|nr:4-amino-4-deoxy-L-arabinose transferase [Gammaproteobacteria bacterium]
MLQSISIIIFSILLSSFAHLSLKKGVSQIELFALNELNVYKIIKIALNPWVFTGMTLHVAALVVWLWALSRVDISFAYPFLALGYVIVG